MNRRAFLKLGASVPVTAWIGGTVGLTAAGVTVGVAQATAYNPATDWFRDAKYGVFQHILGGGSPTDFNNLINGIDVAAIANQLQEAGAKYYCLTLGQNSGYYCAPNATYAGYTGKGDHLSSRDLPLDFYNALNPLGIKLMLYLPSNVPADDSVAANALGATSRSNYDWDLNPTVRERWSAVIQDWSDHYGNKVVGWWFDGGFTQVGFNDTYAEAYANAVKHGNANSIVAFNPGIGNVRYYTDYDDYTAGEQNDITSYPNARWLNGIQWHTLTYLGSFWGQTNTRFSDQTWIDYIQSVTAYEGVVTLDAGPTSNGTISAAQMSQLRAIKAAIRDGATTLINVALNKPASASSVWSSEYAPSKANDGNASGADGWSPAAPNSDLRSWWQVDLGNAYQLSSIELVTRQDGNQPDTRRNFEVRASNDATFASYTVLGGQGTSSLPVGATWQQTLTNGTSFRYIRVAKTIDEYFFIAEVRVFAASTSTSPTNRALNKAASASSVWSNDYPASKANDGVTSGEAGWSPAAPTSDLRPWWQVDLGSAYQLSSIELVTRQDGNQPDTRRNFEVRASNDATFASYTVLGSQGASSLPVGATWQQTVSNGTNFRYIRVAKTIDEYFFLAEVRVFGS